MPTTNEFGDVLLEDSPTSWGDKPAAVESPLDWGDKPDQPEPSEPSMSEFARAERAPTPDEPGIWDEVKGIGRALARGARRFVQQGDVIGLRRPQQIEAEIAPLKRELADHDSEVAPEGISDKAKWNSIRTQRRNDLIGKIAQLEGERARFSEMAPALAESIGSQQNAIEKLPLTQAQADFQKPETSAWDYFKNPVELGATAVAESVPSMVLGVAGSAINPVGGVLAVGAGSHSAESSARVINAMQDAGVDIKNPDEVLAWFANKNDADPDIAKADLAAIGPAAFDALTAGFAGKILHPQIGKGVRRVAAGTAGEIAMQAGGGAAGSIVGNTIVGDPVDWKDAVLEAASEALGAPSETISNIRGERARGSALNPKLERRSAPPVIDPAVNEEQPAGVIAKPTVEDVRAKMLATYKAMTPEQRAGVDQRLSPDDLAWLKQESQSPGVLPETAGAPVEQLELGSRAPAALPQAEPVPVTETPVVSNPVVANTATTQPASEAALRQAAGWIERSGSADSAISLLKKAIEVNQRDNPSVIPGYRAVLNAVEQLKAAPISPATITGSNVRQGTEMPAEAGAGTVGSPIPAPENPTQLTELEKLEVLEDAGVLKPAQRKRLKELRAAEPASPAPLPVTQKVEPVAKPKKSKKVKGDGTPVVEEVIPPLAAIDESIGGISDLPDAAEDAAWVERVLKGIGDGKGSKRTLVVYDNQTGEMRELSVWKNNGPLIQEPSKKAQSGTNLLKFLRTYIKQDKKVPIEDRPVRRLRYVPVASLLSNDSQTGVNRITTPDEILKRKTALAATLGQGPTARKVETKVDEDSNNTEKDLEDVEDKKAGYETVAEFLRNRVGLLGKMTLKQATSAALDVLSSPDREAAFQSVINQFNDEVDSEEFKSKSPSARVSRLEDLFIGAIYDESNKVEGTDAGGIPAKQSGTPGGNPTAGNTVAGEKPAAAGSLAAPVTPAAPAVEQPTGAGTEAVADPEVLDNRPPAADLGEGLAEGEGMAPQAVAAAIASEDTSGVPVQIISKDEAERITGYPETRGYAGFAWQGKAYIVAENIVDERTAREVVREEVSHVLLATPEGVALLNSLVESGKMNLTPEERSALESQGYLPGQILDEFIAKSARENQTWWQKAVASVRAFLSKLGLKLSNQEIALLLLKQLREANRRAGTVVFSNASITPPSPAITAHHGTPHKVDKFTTAKIGTGEGAQVYGWGLYFAGNPAVASEYARKLGANTYPSLETLRKYYAPGNIIPSYGGGHDRVLRFNESSMPGNWSVDVESVVRSDGQWVSDGFKPRNHSSPPSAANLAASGLRPGREYTVTLNVDDDELLDWDKPLSEQSEKVKAALSDAESKLDSTETMFDPKAPKAGAKDLYTALSRSLKVPARNLPAWVIESEMFRGEEKVGSDQRASEYLASLGIKGIRYLDQGSRKFVEDVSRIFGTEEQAKSYAARGERGGYEKLENYYTNGDAWRAWSFPKSTHNYVIFNDDDIEITHENGNPVAVSEVVPTPSAAPAPIGTGAMPNRAPSPSGAGPGGGSTAGQAVPDPASLTQVSGKQMGIGPKVKGPSLDEQIAYTQKVFSDFGIPVRRVDKVDTRLPGNPAKTQFRFAPDGNNYDAQASRLASWLAAEVDRRDHLNTLLMTNLTTSIVNSVGDGDAEAKGADGRKMISDAIQDKLAVLSQIEASETGQKGQARAASSFNPEGDLQMARNVGRNLVRIWSESVGGQEIVAMMEKISSVFRGYYTPEVVQGLLNPLNLDPRIVDMVSDIMATPRVDLKDIPGDISARLQRDFAFPQDTADEIAGRIFRLMEATFAGATDAALKAVQDGLVGGQAKVFKRGGSLWEAMKGATKKGLFDPGEALQKMAEKAGYTVPTESQKEKIKLMVEREEFLRAPTPRQIADAGGDIVKATKYAEAATETARLDIIRKVQAEWSRWSKPVKLLKWFSGNKEIARNNAQAVNEYVSANLLATGTFFVRQALDVGLVTVPLNAATRTLAHVMERAENAGGFTPDTIEELRAASKEMVVSRLASLKASYRQAQQTLAGHATRKILERTTHSIGIFERALVKADELESKGQKAAAMALRASTLLRIGYRIAEVWDAVQGTSLEWQEMRQQLSTALRKAGKPRAAVETQVDDILGGMFLDMQSARTEVALAAAERGETPTAAALERDAWGLTKARAYDRMMEATNGKIDFAEENAVLRELHAWNLPETGGIGGVIADTFKTLKKKTEEKGVPLGGLFAFGNAMGIAANRMATFSGGGLLGGWGFGDSPWYQGDRNIRQRRIEAIAGLSTISLFVALAAAGKILIQTKYPDDKDEKEKFIAEGHKLNTIRWIEDNGDWKEIPISMSPFSYIASPLYMIGGWQRMIADQQREQEKLNKAAALAGVEPGKARELGIADAASILAQGMYGMLTGGRTSGGFVQSFSDYGEFKLNKFITGLTTPYIPALPAWNGAARMMGAAVDTRTGTLLEQLVPNPWSPHQRVNSLGDRLVNPNDGVRILQVLTGGVGYGNENEIRTNQAYRQLFNSGFSTPEIQPNKGFNFDGVIRPMSGREIEAYAAARAENFRKGLESIDTDGMPEEQAYNTVRQVFQQANNQALQSVGVTTPTSRTTGVSGGSGGVLSSGGGGAFGSPVRSPVLGSSLGYSASSRRTPALGGGTRISATAGVLRPKLASPVTTSKLRRPALASASAPKRIARPRVRARQARRRMSSRV